MSRDFDELRKESVFYGRGRNSDDNSHTKVSLPKKGLNDETKNSLINQFVHFWPLYVKFKTASAPSYGTLARLKLIETFPPVGYDSRNKTLIVASLNPNADANPKNEKFNLHTLAYFPSTFFGLPNRADHDAKITVKQIAINFIGGLDWEPETPVSKKVLQILGLLLGIKSIIIPAFKILGIIFNTAFNILKIFTVFLPSFAADASALAIAKLIHRAKDPTRKSNVLGTKIWAWFRIIIFLAPLHYIFRAIAIVGHAFSSPEMSARSAFAAGRDLGGNGPLGVVLGVFFASLSIAISITTWAALLPFTIHLIPAAVYNFVAPVLGPVFAVFKPAIVAVGHFLGPIFSPILGNITANVGIQISTTTASIGIGLAAIATPIVAIASRLVEEASNRWISSWRTGGLLREKFEKLESTLSDGWSSFKGWSLTFCCIKITAGAPSKVEASLGSSKPPIAGSLSSTPNENPSAPPTVKTTSPASQEGEAPAQRASARTILSGHPNTLAAESRRQRAGTSSDTENNYSPPPTPGYSSGGE